MAELNERGHEVLDDTPVALPLKFRRQSFVDQIQSFIRAELSRQADDQGHESFEEADDFWIDDDDLPRSQYELEADQEFAELYRPEPDPEPSSEPTATPEVPSGGSEG